MFHTNSLWVRGLKDARAVQRLRPYAHDLGGGLWQFERADRCPEIRHITSYVEPIISYVDIRYPFNVYDIYANYDTVCLTYDIVC